MVLLPTEMRAFLDAFDDLICVLEQAQGKMLHGEPLHDYRVSLRRLAAIAPLLFSAAAGKEIMRAIKKELRHSNSLRDRDVLLTYLSAQMPQIEDKALSAESGYQPANKRLERVLTRLGYWSPPATELEHSRFVADFSLLQLRSWTLLRERLMGLERALYANHLGGEVIIDASHRLRVIIKSARYLQEWQARLQISAAPTWPELRMWQERLGYASDRSMIADWLQANGWRREAALVEKDLRQWQQQLPALMPPLKDGCDCRLEQLARACLSGYFFH